MPYIDMSGKQLGLLRVIEKTTPPEDVNGNIRASWWLCRCRCGREVVKPRNYLIRSPTPNCGCIRDEVKREAVHKVVAKEKARRAAHTTRQAEAALNIVTFTQTRICPQCGKVFETFTDEWGYKRDRVCYCSWHCVRAYDRQAKKKRPYARRKG